MNKRDRRATTKATTNVTNGTNATNSTETNAPANAHTTGRPLISELLYRVGSSDPQSLVFALTVRVQNLKK